jgi:ribosomal protein S18 acetylase RimI-like enzyme
VFQTKSVEVTSPVLQDGAVDVEVRRIRAGEWRQYRRLRLEALKDSPLAFVEQYDDMLTRPDRFWQERVERSATDADSMMVVAVDNGRFVGKAGCFIEPEVVDRVSAYVVGVYVSPSHRGSDVARSLLESVTGWARRDCGADRIRLFVMDTNDRAVAFYRRLGFVPTGDTMPYPPDPSLTEMEMELRDRA